MHSKLAPILLAVYGLVLGFFLGMSYMGIMPFKWPINVIVGYLLGGAMGLVVAFGLFKPWKLKTLPKVMVAIGLLVFVAAISVQMTLLTLQVGNLTIRLDGNFN